MTIRFLRKVNFEYRGAVSIAKESPRPRPRRDVLQQRISGLETLRVGLHPVDTEVRAHLTRWGQGPSPAPPEVAIRSGFMRRLHPLVEGVEYEEAKLVDRPKPTLLRQPPLAALAALTKGVGLRTGLTLLYLAQTGDALGKEALLKITIDGEDEAVGLVDLIAVPASHNPSKDATFASNSRNNRKRQIRDALLQLDKLGIAEVPAGGRKGELRFDDRVHLNRESGRTAAGAKRYTRPSATNKIVSVPTTFFTNGWVHALNKSETAMWLMLRDLRERSETMADRLLIRARDRLLEYDLSRAMWDTHSKLEEYGLIVVHRDPNRRRNGTTEAGERALPHFFELRDEGLAEEGLPKVIATLNEIRSRKAN